MAWYRRDKAAVTEALRRGERPDLATTMASGPVDELVALHEELGIFAILDEIEVQRTRTGIADELLLRGQRVLPDKAQASGFKFRHETLPSALSAILGDTAAQAHGAEFTRTLEVQRAR